MGKAKTDYTASVKSRKTFNCKNESIFDKLFENLDGIFDASVGTLASTIGED